MNSATMMLTEFRVMTSSSSSRMLATLTPHSDARCALLNVGRPPNRKHCGTYADDTYDTSSQSVTEDMRSKPLGAVRKYSSPFHSTRSKSRVPGAYTKSCTASLSLRGNRRNSSTPFSLIW